MSCSGGGRRREKALTAQRCAVLAVPVVEAACWAAAHMRSRASSASCASFCLTKRSCCQIWNESLPAKAALDAVIPVRAMNMTIDVFKGVSVMRVGFRVRRCCDDRNRGPEESPPYHANFNLVSPVARILARKKTIEIEAEPNIARQLRINASPVRQFS